MAIYYSNINHFWVLFFNKYLGLDLQNSDSDNMDWSTNSVFYITNLLHLCGTLGTINNIILVHYY